MMCNCRAYSSEVRQQGPGSMNFILLFSLLLHCCKVNYLQSFGQIGMLISNILGYVHLKTWISRLLLSVFLKYFTFFLKSPKQGSLSLSIHFLLILFKLSNGTTESVDTLDIQIHFDKEGNVEEIGKGT